MIETWFTWRVIMTDRLRGHAKKGNRKHEQRMNYRGNQRKNSSSESNLKYCFKVVCFMLYFWHAVQKFFELILGDIFRVQF